MRTDTERRLAVRAQVTRLDPNEILVARHRKSLHARQAIACGDAVEPM
jgi:hypothetical protein